MTRALTCSNDTLSAMFGIDIEDAMGPAPEMTGVICGKCKGRGKFVGWSGRVVGNCFTCDGTGLTRSAGVALNPGDCAKCTGTGAWRPGHPCFACNGTGRETASEEITVTAIVTAFEAARGHGIKSPRLRLDDFIFSRAPDHGVNAGAIYVKAKKSNEYLGKVTAGKFRPTLACDAATTERVIAVAGAPHEAAKAYGQRTGECACCGRELTNGVSIDLGIGPICRDKYGWG
jgi:hypothetical protein